jgi:hypothetical protein
VPKPFPTEFRRDVIAVARNGEAAMGLAAAPPPSPMDVRIRSLRRSHIEHWIKSMISRGLAPGTVHTRANNVRAVLRGAVADRVIPRDPSEGAPSSAGVVRRLLN